MASLRVWHSRMARLDSTLLKLERNLKVGHIVWIFVVPVETTSVSCRRLGDVLWRPPNTQESPIIPKEFIIISCTLKNIWLPAPFALFCSLIKELSSTSIKTPFKDLGCTGSVSYVVFSQVYRQYFVLSYHVTLPCMSLQVECVCVAFREYVSIASA